jgi:hypothetical protein
VVLTPIPPPEMGDDPEDAGLALPPLGFEEPREILSASRRAAPQPQFIW